MGCWANLWDLLVPDNFFLEELDFCNGKIDPEGVQEQVEKYDGINGHFRFFQAYMPISLLYQTCGKPLLSMKASGLMDGERDTKHFKHFI